MQITQTTIEQNQPLEGGIYAQKENNVYSDVKSKLEEIISSIISPKTLSIEEEINNRFLELDFGAEYEVDAAKIGVQDAIFFVNLLNQNNIINYSVEDGKVSLNCSEKEINPTQGLLNILSSSYETKKPVRLDFDENITVILKLDNKDKIQVHFIPGTPDVESYLKQNIPSLKQIFDNEDINYSYLGYSKNKQENKKQKRSNK